MRAAKARREAGERHRPLEETRPRPERRLAGIAPPLAIAGVVPPLAPAADELQAGYGNAAVARAALAGEVAPPAAGQSAAAPATVAPRPVALPAAARPSVAPLVRLPEPPTARESPTSPAAAPAASPAPPPSAPVEAKAYGAPAEAPPPAKVQPPAPPPTPPPETAKVEESAPKPEAAAAAAEEAEKPEAPAAAAPGKAAPAGAAPGPAGAAGGGEAGPAAEPEPVPITATDPGGILEQLAAVPPLQAAATYTEAETASASALESQAQQAQEELPEIPAPTGLPAGEAAAGEEAEGEAAVAAAELEMERETGREEEPYDTAVEEAPPPPPQPATRLPAVSSPEDEEAAAELAEEAQGSLASISFDASEIDTTAEEPPAVDTTGEADPGQMGSFEQDSDAAINAAKLKAVSATAADFGENDVFPAPDPEILEAHVTLSALAPQVAGGGEALALPPEAAGLNDSLGPVLAERIQAKKQEYDSGEDQFDVDREQARTDADAQIATLEEETRKTQEGEQGRAKDAVAGAREEWRAELDNIETDYHTKADKAGEEHRTKVADEKAKGDEEAAGHLAEAERKATAAKAEAEEEARQKKKDAEEESDGFWGWVTSAASALIDGLKAAVNFVYDNLRKAVKLFYETAKKLALAAIELARKAIVAYIKVYGAFLKGLVSIAFFAFPDLEKKIKAKIDQAVDLAVEGVNKAADLLKKGVSAIIDFLASTIDSLLGLIQSLYNGIFTVIGMLIRGEFQELMQRIGYLIDAAKTTPEQFQTAALEELLGGNLDKPLSPAELLQAGIAPPSQGAEGVPPMEPGKTPRMPAPPWNEGNVGVDAVDPNMELSPELAQDLATRTGGEGSVEIASSEDESRTMDAVMAESSPAGGEGAKAGEEEPQYQDDGLSPKQRAEIKWTQMKEGIAKWWSDNWPTILAAAAAALVGFIALNIVTGGAITAALPAIMAIVGPLFIGLTIATLAGHVKAYLEQGWEGQIQPAGKSLAKGLAAGAIELISYLTFKAGGAVLKGAKALAKGGVKLAKGAVKVATSGAKFVISKGKVIFQGIANSGLGKLVKRLGDLGDELLKRLRFRKFRITLSGRWFILEGFINPWFVIAKGQVNEVKKGTKKAQFRSADDLKALKTGGTPKTGPLKGGEVGNYRVQSKPPRSVKGDDLTPDHIPSRASLVKAKEAKLGRKLTMAEKDVINREGVTIATETDIHKAGRTFGGKNVREQIALDARDLGTAARKDVEACLDAHRARGTLDSELVGSYLRLYRENVLKGVFKYSQETDEMFMRFIKEARKA